MATPDSAKLGHSTNSDDYAGVDKRRFTVAEAIAVAGFSGFQWKLYFIAGFMEAAKLMEIMVTIFIIPIITSEWGLVKPWNSFSEVMLFTGVLVGGLCWPYLKRIYGTRIIITVINMLVAIFGTLQIFAPNNFLLSLFRFLAGLGVAGSGIGTTIFAELCPTSSKQTFMMFKYLFPIAGMTYCVFFAWLFLDQHPHIWYMYIAICNIPKYVVLVMGWMYIPESPSWYLANGQKKVAEMEIKRIFIENKKPWLKGELIGRIAEDSNSGFCDLFVPDYRWISVVVLISCFLVSFLYFGVFFLSKPLFGSYDLYLGMIISIWSEFPGILWGIWFTKQFGPKLTLSIGWFVNAGTCTTLYLMLIINDGGEIWIITVLCVLIGKAAMWALWVIIYVYITDAYPTVIVATALGFGGCLSEVGAIVTTLLVYNISKINSLLIFSLSSVFAFTLTVFLLPKDITRVVLQDKNERDNMKSTSGQLSEDIIWDNQTTKDFQASQKKMLKKKLLHN